MMIAVILGPVKKATMMRFFLVSDTDNKSDPVRFAVLIVVVLMTLIVVVEKKQQL